MASPSPDDRARASGGRGGRGGRGSRGQQRSSRNADGSTPRRGKRGGRGNKGRSVGDSAWRDEEAMIAFMHLIRSGNAEARKIHLELGGNQRLFVEAAKRYLAAAAVAVPVPVADSNNETESGSNLAAQDTESHQHVELTAPPVPEPHNTLDDDEDADFDLEKMVGSITMQDLEEHDDDEHQASAHAASIIMPCPPGIFHRHHEQHLASNDLNSPSTAVRQPSHYSQAQQSHHPLEQTHCQQPAQSEPPAPRQPRPQPTKRDWQPKRILTRREQQPGHMLANNQESTLVLGPRKELLATWKLPLAYLRERTLQKVSTAPEHLTIRDALQSLTVGLFRRGCTENGTNSSIISKEVVPSNGDDCHFEIKQQHIWGTVPFYTPRTSGNVVLRLYFEDDIATTLATGPCIKVCVSEGDVEPTLRFILSNFKAKKGTANFSSVHSLATVLEQFAPNLKHNEGRSDYNNNNQRSVYDGAGRAAWGCICEARKVMETSWLDYSKKRTKLLTTEEEMKQLKAIMDSQEKKGACVETSVKVSHGMTMDEWREKMSVLMGERASNERKWREVQTAFASVLKSVSSNSSSPLLLKRDVVTKLRLELELWCPFCEAFAPNPFFEQLDGERNDKEMSFTFPHPITSSHFLVCLQSRARMQKDVLGFVPKTTMLHHLFPKNGSGKKNGNQLDSRGLCRNLTDAIELLYVDEYMTTPEIIQRRERARAYTEQLVAQCNEFPPETRVVVFGSSANGFGAPNADLDMCLQLPQSSSLLDKNDATGASAMTKLATQLEDAGMTKIDLGRLTARIPVLMFKCPLSALPDSQPEEEQVIMDCDLSMQNPLACLNTALLLSYSNTIPQVQVLASIIKRWAKNRDINSPSNHTLSSYGYIIMLLHMLTFHGVTSDGEFVPVSQSSTTTVLLPNLQWMDQRWLQSPPGTPYQEWPEKPKNQYCTMPHPSEPTFVVNTYFYRIADQTLRRRLMKESFPSVAFLLAAFFRYYAYDFDYKRHVVSLNSTIRSGLVEREAKAEFHGWKLYGQSLCIEDPFETFYDVAHVLKPSNFQRIRREFALAYSKIVDAFTGDTTYWSNTTDLKKMSGSDLLDWICEPVSHDDG